MSLILFQNYFKKNPHVCEAQRNNYRCSKTLILENSFYMFDCFFPHKFSFFQTTMANLENQFTEHYPVQDLFFHIGNFCSSRVRLTVYIFYGHKVQYFQILYFLHHNYSSSTDSSKQAQLTFVGCHNMLKSQGNVPSSFCLKIIWRRLRI